MAHVSTEDFARILGITPAKVNQYLRKRVIQGYRSTAFGDIEFDSIEGSKQIRTYEALKAIGEKPQKLEQLVALAKASGQTLTLQKFSRKIIGSEEILNVIAYVHGYKEKYLTEEIKVDLDDDDLNELLKSYAEQKCKDVKYDII